MNDISKQIRVRIVLDDRRFRLTARVMPESFHLVVQSPDVSTSVTTIVIQDGQGGQPKRGGKRY